MHLDDAVRRGWVGMQRSPNQSFALLADEDADVRAVLSVAVGRAGLASVQVEDGRQAIETLANLYPSIVMLDVQMPGLSGIEVCWWDPSAALPRGRSGDPGQRTRFAVRDRCRPASRSQPLHGEAVHERPRH